MSIATVVTRGYGSFGSVNEVVSRGYTISAVAVDRGDIIVGERKPKQTPREIYAQQKRLYYRQLQDELNRQLEAKAVAEAPPVTTAKARKAKVRTQAIERPLPVAMPPMVAAEASRIVAEMIAEKERSAEFKRFKQEVQRQAAFQAELDRIAGELARQRDEEDIAVILKMVDDSEAADQRQLGELIAQLARLLEQAQTRRKHGERSDTSGGGSQKPTLQ